MNLNTLFYKGKRFSHHLLNLSIIILLGVITSCSDSEHGQESNQSKEIIGDISQNVNENTINVQSSDNNDSGLILGLVQEEIDYRSIRYRITYSSASYSDVLKSLTEQDVGGLTNTIHALYSMRWHRRVYRLLHDLWEMNREQYPNFAWESLETAPVRVALASTIFRIKSLNTTNNPDLQQYKKYIRENKQNEHEFVRAQVVVALGLAGDPVDVAYIKEMASGDIHYVTQSAITALGLMNNRQASNALIELYNNYKDDARGKLILEMLAKAYDLHPTNVPPDEQSKF